MKKRNTPYFRQMVSNTLWVYRQMFNLSKRDTLLLILFILAGAIIPTMSAFVSARFLDETLSLVTSDVSSIFEIQANTAFVTILIITVLMLTSRRLIRNCEFNMVNRFRKYHFRFFEMEMKRRVSELDVIQLENTETFDTIRKGFDSLSRFFLFVRYSTKLISTVTGLVISAVISFQISPVISIIILILAIPSNVVSARFIKIFWNFHDTTVQKRRRLSWIISKIQSISDIPEYKITNVHRYLFKLAHQKGSKLWKEETDLDTMQFRSNLLTTFFHSIVYLATPVYLANLIFKGLISIGEFTFYRKKLFDFSAEIDSVISQYLDFSDNIMHISCIRKVFELKPVVIDGSVKLKSNTPPEIKFQNVSFKYPNSNNYALKKINLTIKPGEEIAIVGENGAGKSTLIKLLLRFYNPTDGKITIDGTPIEKLSLQHYYNLISVMFQDFTTYGMLDIKDNIYLGKTSSSMNIPMIQKAAKDADADTFINDLDNKYDQILSTHFTGGTKISKGQWQKIALARMFYRNTPVLILDEPTASIDAKAEYRIFKKIYNFIKDKTVIIISHRFSTVRNAQNIYVMDKGEIIERGCHNDLIELNGKYAEAFNLQAKGYQNS